MAGSVCEPLLDILAEDGVRQIFGMKGDALHSLLVAIRRDGRFELEGVRHEEETGAFAAAAQAKLSGNQPVCSGRVVPGDIHLINGLYDAKRDHAPVLAIAGHVPLVEQGSGYLQEFDPHSLFQDVTVYDESINSMAHLSIPTDVINQKVAGREPARDIFVPRAQIIPCPDELLMPPEIQPAHAWGFSP
jgi:thiamine pyrophosphate-dependent acetolactate synthase large subunit-like protein